MNYLAWFDEIPDGELALKAGGKGASLCRLVRGKLPVPPGFIVTSGMFNFFMEEHGFFDRIAKSLEGIDVDNNQQLANVAEGLRNMIVGTKICTDLDGAIRSYYATLGDSANSPVAVRSSGTDEDLDDASFAGQQETYLYVIGEDTISHYIKMCWASLYNDRAIFYRKYKGFDERGISIAVVVQRMVAAEKSGVMFTANPVTGNRDECMIEGSWGLGEAIVSGIVTPDSYILGKDGRIKDISVSEKETMIIRSNDGSGVEELEVPEDKKNLQVLSEDELKGLVDLACRVERYFGKPQDLEWAIEKGELFLLQSRPITTL
jgi:pyruvate,water dikinase